MSAAKSNYIYYDSLALRLQRITVQAISETKPSKWQRDAWGAPLCRLRKPPRLVRRVSSRETTNDSCAVASADALPVALTTVLRNSTVGVTSGTAFRKQTPVRGAAFRAMLAGCTLGFTVAAGPALAQTAETESWQFGLTVYAYLPAISGTAYFPVPGTGATFNLNQSQLIDNLKMTFMGAFDVRHGRWGFFGDVLYLDLGRRHTNTHDFTIGDIGIPADTTSDVSIDLKSWIATAAGEYRVLAEGGSTLDLLMGLRYLSVNERLQWNFTGSIGSLPEAARSGNQEISSTIVDGIVGMKGRLQGDGGWFMPVYLDVGTGGAQLTWQGVIGLAYGFHWGEVGLLYRYIDFRFDSSKLQDLSIAGPMVSATFRW